MQSCFELYAVQKMHRVAAVKKFHVSFSILTGFDAAVFTGDNRSDESGGGGCPGGVRHSGLAGLKLGLRICHFFGQHLAVLRLYS